MDRSGTSLRGTQLGEGHLGRGPNRGDGRCGSSDLPSTRFPRLDHAEGAFMRADAPNNVPTWGRRKEMKRILRFKKRTYVLAGVVAVAAITAVGGYAYWTYHRLRCHGRHVRNKLYCWTHPPCCRLRRANPGGPGSDFMRGLRTNDESIHIPPVTRAMTVVVGPVLDGWSISSSRCNVRADVLGNGASSVQPRHDHQPMEATPTPGESRSRTSTW